MSPLQSMTLRSRITRRRKILAHRLRQHRERHLMWGIAIGLAAGIAFITLRAFGLLDSLELRTFDWRMQATRHAERGSGENVALFYVDEPSLKTMKEMGVSWPWPRELYESALEFAKRGGAKAIVFDLFFSEPSSYGVDDDESFGRGIAAGPPSYFVLFASKERETPSDEVDHVLQKSRVPFAGPLPSFAPRAQSLQSLPIPQVQATATGFGNAQTVPDVDGVYRRAPMVMNLQGSALPQVALKVVSDLKGIQSMRWPTVHRMYLDATKIPLDDDGSLIINYIGGVDSYPTYPLAQVLVSNQQLREGKTADLDPAVLKDRVVIVGVAAPGLYDLKPMPLARVYPGPEVHATVIDALLREDFIVPVRWQARMLLVLFLSLAAAIGLSQMQRLTHIMVWIVSLAAVYTALAIGLFSFGVWMPLVGPLGALSLSSFTMILKSYLTEGRRKHAIKKAFGQYLSPAVVSEIAMNPDSIKMGGSEREVTVFFSDIADFTSISEKLSPVELVEQLCSYLTQVTRIITGREGTLDKYIGDAVMSFWGAPLKIPDHAAQAVLAAMEVQQALAAFPQFRTRIGIHTGKCVVGNVGSDLRFNYTAIGDTVNLASRLEGLNKKFGTRIIVSESTFAKAKHAIEARMIGKVRVKGRMEPIAIYEPLCPKGELEETALKILKRFDEAMNCFMAADFSGAKAGFQGLSPESDTVVASYMSLCDRFEKSPPAKPFDGVIVFHEK